LGRPSHGMKRQAWTDRLDVSAIPVKRKQLA
jgi:hypothetical protein